MRVLHLDSGREMRGGQWQALKLLEGLGNGCTLLTPAEGPLMRAVRARGLDAQPFSMLALASTARRFDLVHAHDARSHTWAAAFMQTPLVVSRRVAFPVSQSFLSRWKYNRPHRFLAVSEHVKRTLIDAEVPEDRISVVYDGVDLPETTSTGDRLIAPASADPMKGNDLLSEAASLAGLTIHYSSDLARDLSTAAVLVYITRSEGLGSAALLAMAHGVPVVASRVGGLPEIVQDGVTGVLTGNDPREIAAAIHRALSLHDNLAPQARLRVEQRFSTQHMIDNTREAYRQVLV